MWVDVALDGAVGAVSSFVRLRQKAARKRKTDRAFVSSVPRCDRNSRDSSRSRVVVGATNTFPSVICRSRVEEEIETREIEARLLLFTYDRNRFTVALLEFSDRCLSPRTRGAYLRSVVSLCLSSETEIIASFRDKTVLSRRLSANFLRAVYIHQRSKRRPRELSLVGVARKAGIPGLHFARDGTRKREAAAAAASLDVGAQYSTTSTLRRQMSRPLHHRSSARRARALISRRKNGGLLSRDAPMDVPKDPVDFVSGPNVQTSRVPYAWHSIAWTSFLVSTRARHESVRILRHVSRRDRRPKRIGEATKWPSLAHAVEFIAAGKWPDAREMHRPEWPAVKTMFSILRRCYAPRNGMRIRDI